MFPFKNEEGQGMTRVYQGRGRKDNKLPLFFFPVISNWQCDTKVNGFAECMALNKDCSICWQSQGVRAENRDSAGVTPRQITPSADGALCCMVRKKRRQERS